MTKSFDLDSSEPEAMMRAIRIHEHGDAGVLRFESAPRPQVGPDEVLIRTVAAGVNPADWKIRSGAFAARRPSVFPEILGTELSGVIDTAGALVSGFAVGDPVIARVEGAYAEYVIAKADYVARAPSSLPLAEAAALPVAAGVAWLVLFDVAKLRAGQTVLVHAGAGGVGGMAVQLAKRAGAHVIATCSGENIDHVLALGADQAIDYRLQDVGALVEGVDVVFDTVGGETQTRSFACLRPGGLLASVVQPPDQALAASLGVRASFGRRDLNGAILEQLARLVDRGLLKVVVDSVWPLADAASAHRRSETGHAKGKILLLASEQ